MPALTGIEAAAPILIDAFARLGLRVPLPDPPPGILTAATADLPPPLRHVGRPEDQGGSDAPEIAFPPPGARLAMGGRATQLVLKVRNGTPPFTWLANGAPVAREPYTHTALWTPDGPGFTTLAVVDGEGRASRVQVFVQRDP